MKKEEQNRIKAELAQFNETENYYKHFAGVKYTDGVKFLAEKLNCFWFLDVIASYQPKLRETPLQIWKIQTNGDQTGVVTMRDDSDQPIRIGDYHYRRKSSTGRLEACL